MDRKLKLCKVCHGKNAPDNAVCLHCGAEFVMITKSSGPKNISSDIINPVNIAAIVLFGSLFLPWVSNKFISLNAFKIADIYSLFNVLGRGDPIITMITWSVYLIPAGCAAVAILPFFNQSIRTIGMITGMLPIGFIFLLLIKKARIIEGFSIGVIVALFSGIVLTFSARNEE